jgi:hypothetical protein
MPMRAQIEAAQTASRAATTSNGVLFELYTDVVCVEPRIKNDERPQP